MQNKNEFRGFSLFSELEDKELQTRNRATIMVNMLEDNFQDGKVSAKGAMLVLGYMSRIDGDERKGLMQSFVEQANKRGFKIANP